MSSGTSVIQDALQEIGAHSVLSPASPESISVGMRVLNSMIEQWASLGIDMGTVPLKNPGDELSEPLGARNGIVKNLAVVMAPKFDNGDNVVSMSLQKEANSGYRFIRRMYQVITIPQKTVSSTMPMGANNSRLRGYNRKTFAGKDKKIDG